METPGSGRVPGGGEYSDEYRRTAQGQSKEYSGEYSDVYDDDEYSD